MQARKKVSKDTYYAWRLLRNKVTNSLFVAVGLHLTPYDGVMPDQDRLAEAQQTYAKVTSAVLATYPGVPLVISGDLNSLLRRHLDRCDSDLERYRVGDYFTTLGLGDVRLRAEQAVNGDESSYVRDPSDPRDLCAQFQLDHIYTSISTRVIGWKLWVQPFTDYGTRFSDHEMVSSTLALPSF